MCSLCENILMQIDANDVVMYMQISHATTLWFLFFRDRETLVRLFVDAHVCQFMFGCMSGVFVFENGYFHRATNAINTPSPINLTVLADFAA